MDNIYVAANICFGNDCFAIVPFMLSRGDDFDPSDPSDSSNSLLADLVCLVLSCFLFAGFSPSSSGPALFLAFIIS